MEDLDDDSWEAREEEAGECAMELMADEEYAGLEASEPASQPACQPACQPDPSSPAVQAGRVMIFLADEKVPQETRVYVVVCSLFGHLRVAHDFTDLTQPLLALTPLMGQVLAPPWQQRLSSARGEGKGSQGEV